MGTQHITLALTGASGARYGLRLLRALLLQQQEVDLLISAAARVVLRQECDLHLPEGDPLALREELGRVLQAEGVEEWSGVRYYATDDWYAPIASGSGAGRAMVICPCSMGSLAAIAHGMSDNLLERAADVMIKERRPLILVPRESPFSVIHLQNMLTLAQMGVTILPAAPGFYHRPTTVEALLDFVVERILSHLGLASSGALGWPPTV
ncbi:UbiX family flavin prenyltransferase [Candidatus Magnetaquicoccus inordinatus]|uniref:UbiX family flavin prenyltransferase n=1 Tax=Candidatus Magnetaquicoccus inordinatus TaxID=2496818 RepID=UPI00102CC989|nr:flavin prenyltransferase UbiX [Candidatus Magnetaquicoccus inordinatus]